MPYPQNLNTAREVEAVVRQHGAVPATIAIIAGQPCIGEGFGGVHPAFPAHSSSHPTNLSVLLCSSERVSVLFCSSERVSVASFPVAAYSCILSLSRASANMAYWPPHTLNISKAYQGQSLTTGPCSLQSCRVHSRNHRACNHHAMFASML